MLVGSEVGGLETRQMAPIWGCAFTTWTVQQEKEMPRLFEDGYGALRFAF